MAVDGSNNLLVTGYFSDTVDFGGGPSTALTSAGNYDGFLVKYENVASAAGGGVGGVPTVGEWGLIILSLIFLIMGTVAIRRYGLALAS